jgi:hypothetical protein
MTSYRDRLTSSTPPSEVALRPFRTPVRGHPFAAPPPGAQEPHPGQRAQLQREPRNPADPLAVAVWTEDGAGWWRVGYLDRGVAGRLAPRIDRGQAIDARIDGWVPEPQGRWRRPVVLLLPEGEPSGSGPRAAGPPALAAEDPPPALAAEDPPPALAAEDPPPALAAEDPPPARLWGRPPGATVRPVRERARR